MSARISSYKLPQCPAAGPPASLSTALPAGVYAYYMYNIWFTHQHSNLH